MSGGEVGFVHLFMPGIHERTAGFPSGRERVRPERPASWRLIARRRARRAAAPPRAFEAADARVLRAAAEEAPRVPFWKKELRLRRRRDADVVREESSPERADESRADGWFAGESTDAGAGDVDRSEDRPRRRLFGRKPKQNDDPEPEPFSFDESSEEEERPRRLFGRRPKESEQTESIELEPVAFDEPVEQEDEERPRRRLFGRKPKTDELDVLEPVAFEEDAEEKREERPRRGLFGRGAKHDDTVADAEPEASLPDEWTVDLEHSQPTLASADHVHELVADGAPMDASDDDWSTEVSLAAAVPGDEEARFEHDDPDAANEQVRELLAWWDEIQRSVGPAEDAAPTDEKVVSLPAPDVVPSTPPAADAPHEVPTAPVEIEPVSVGWDSFENDAGTPHVAEDAFAAGPDDLEPAAPVGSEDQDTAVFATAEPVPAEPVEIAPDPVALPPVEPEPVSFDPEPVDVTLVPEPVMPQPVEIAPEPVLLEIDPTELVSETDGAFAAGADAEPSGRRSRRFMRRRRDEDGFEEDAPRRRRGRKKDEDAKPKRARSKPSRGVKKIVGLKIGASQLAAATIANNGSPELVQLARESLEPGIVVGGELRDPDALAEALTAFFQKHKLPKKGVRLGVSSNRIGVRSFEIVGIDDPKQLTNAVRFRAQDALPIPLGEAALDYQVLEESVDEAGQTVRRVLLVVVYKDLVERYVAACKAAGIKLVGIDLEAFAVLRALAEPRPEEVAPAGALVVVNVGHDRSTLAVSDGRFCEFTRVLDWGGASLDVALARALNATPSEVAPLKRSIDLEASSATPEGDVAKARDVVLEQINVFARELVSSLHFYQSQPDSLEIGEIVLTGGGSHLTGLAAQLEQLTGVTVRVGDPLSRVHLKKNVTAADPVGSLAVAIGLGIED